MARRGKSESSYDLSGVARTGLGRFAAAEFVDFLFEEKTNDAVFQAHGAVVVFFVDNENVTDFAGDVERTRSGSGEERFENDDFFGCSRHGICLQVVSRSSAFHSLLTCCALLVRCYTADAKCGETVREGHRDKRRVKLVRSKVAGEVKSKSTLLSLLMALNTAKSYLIAKCCAS
jgi:hypothetical protein